MGSVPLYSLRVADVYSTLETSPEGLSSQEAAARLLLYGRNVLAEPPTDPLWRKFITHSIHPMALLLWAAGVIGLVSGHPLLAVIMWLIVLANATLSFWQEYRAERAITALKQLLPIYARVIRDGAEVQIPASDVVPGEVLVLAEGDNIPADARVVEEYGLRVNNSTLTGEPLPAHKTAEASVRPDMTEVERPNLVFAGTSIVSGTGRAVAFATGMTTQFGRIANLTQAVIEEPSPIHQELTRVTRKATLIAIGLGAIVLLVGLSDSTLQPGEVAILAIGLIAAVLPEGLLPTVTLTLAIAVQRLAKRGVLVKKLAVMETLGKTSVLCTDKSGTLTQNQMTVREVWVAGQRLSVSGVGYEPKGEFSPSPVNTSFEGDLNVLLRVALLCNNSRLNPPTPERPHWTSLGDQTEAALRVVALKGGVNQHMLNTLFPRIHELPFDARRKRMSTIHRETSRGDEVAFVKGAPKEVLQLCTHILYRGEVCPLDNVTRVAIVAANDDYARNALRVLALARRDLPPRSGAAGYTPERVEQGLTFLGLAAMMDPPRLDVEAAVKTCREAGIRIVMITGDYGLTAESVARRIGMLSTLRPRIMTGADVEALSDADLQAALNEEIIFARMAPEHKLRVVAAFQARGDVVAVTGDGVNDAPALRKSDIGIAMGVTGTDVAKEAADMILINDQFAAIASAIEEGRAVFDNLRKFITYIFASNVPEVMPFVLMGLFNLPLALTVVQVLAIDIGTDLLPALALGTEKPEPRVMRRPPRQRLQPLIDRRVLRRAFAWLGVIETVLCYAGFFAIYFMHGYTDLTRLPSSGEVYALASTVFFAGVITAQIGNAFACRTETDQVHQLGWLSNRFLLLGILIEIVLLLVSIYAVPPDQVFDHRPLQWQHWAGLILYAPVVFGLDRIRKGIIRSKGKRARPAHGSKLNEGGVIP